MLLFRRAAAFSAAAVLAAGLAVVVAPAAAEAHGTMMVPGSRTFLCWRDALTANGEIKPTNAACAAAVGQSGANSLYNWFGVLRSDAGGRTTGYIPDGQLCSGGNPGFTGYNLARTDWPVTHLTAGGDFSWRYSNWAAHPGTFYLYVTRDSWSPTRALAWSDLEAQPFLTITNPGQNGAAGTNDGHYYWNGRLPAGKSGRHVIYSRWVRSDSQENFFACSDVAFDGGRGEVTGIRGGGTPPTPGPTDPAPSSPAPSSPAPSEPQPGNPGPGSCMAAYRAVGDWAGGFQGEVTVMNHGASTAAGWTATLTLPAGAAVNNLWNGASTTSGSTVTVRNANWNGALAANGSTTFGFVANGAGAPTVACTLS
ncbi:MAG TPA: lytic polysaccharide monooxygenase [Catenuloplanes sp.]|jgi:chitin-binding protein